jgi:hypothetical protein
MSNKPKKYAVSRKIRKELSEMSVTQMADNFTRDVLDKCSKEYAKAVDDEIYEALRPKIEFNVEEDFWNIIITVKDYKQISDEELSIFIQEIDLNILEQFGAKRK